MTQWATYFFGSFFSGRLAKVCANKSIANAIGGCILAGAMILTGLYAGHAASFSHLWNGAQSYRNDIYSAFSSGELSFEIQNGTASSSSTYINTYISDPSRSPVIVADFRDIEDTYVAFSVGYATQDGNTISTEAYQALPEAEKENYKFYVDCTDEVIDPSDPTNIAQYQSFLSSLPDTSDYSKLDTNAEDYADQLYALYVSSQYSQITTPPVLLNYYNQILDELNQHAYFIVLQNHCYLSFTSGDIPVSASCYYTKDISSQELMDTTDRIDLFISDLFSSSNPVTLFLYFYNLPRTFPTIAILWLLLAVCSYIVCKSKNLTCGNTMLSSLKICGSFLFFSGVISGLFGFVGSFFASQSQIYSHTLSVFYLVFGIRCIVFFVANLLFPKKTEDSIV